MAPYISARTQPIRLQFDVLTRLTPEDLQSMRATGTQFNQLLGPSKRRTVAHVELPAEAPADDASSDDGEETWSPSQAPTGAEINHSNQARARRSRPMPPAPRAGGLVRMRKAKRIKEVTTPYLCKASIKRALLTALQIEADKAEVCPQGPAQVCCIASHVNFIFANDIGPHR